MPVVYPGATLTPHFRDFRPGRVAGQPWYRGNLPGGSKRTRLAPGMTRLVVKLGSSSVASGGRARTRRHRQPGYPDRGRPAGRSPGGAGHLGGSSARPAAAHLRGTHCAGPVRSLQRLVDVVRTSVSQDSASATVSALTATLDRYDGADLSGPVGLALAASVGQPALMAIYRQLAAAVGVEVCQILLSKSDLDSASAMRDVGAVLISALDQGLLPVVNGNDTTDHQIRAGQRPDRGRGRRRIASLAADVPDQRGPAYTPTGSCGTGSRG